MDARHLACLGLRPLTACTDSAQLGGGAGLILGTNFMYNDPMKRETPNRSCRSRTQGLWLGIYKSVVSASQQMGKFLFLCRAAVPKARMAMNFMWVDSRGPETGLGV